MRMAQAQHQVIGMNADHAQRNDFERECDILSPSLYHARRHGAFASLGSASLTRND